MYYDRVFAVFWMLLGCCLYTFVIGSLTSLMSNVDKKKVQYHEYFNVLMEIKQEHKISQTLFTKINKYLKYDLQTYFK